MSRLPLALLFFLSLPARPAFADEVLVLGDVEGRMEIIESFVERINAAAGHGTLAFSEDRSRLLVKAGYKFVFLGDAIDHGKDSMAILDLLNATKRAQPDRIELIMGNRDGNKVRLARELTPDALEKIPEGFSDWLELQLPEPRRRASPDPLSNRELRARFLLAATMASRNAFEFRRQELSARENGASVTDKAVTDSLIADYAPDGRGAEYLRHSKALVLEGGAVFLHAALTDANVDLLERHAHLGPERAIEEVNREHRARVERALDPAVPGGHEALIGEVSRAAPRLNNPRSLAFSNFTYSRDGKALTLLGTKRVQTLFARWGLHTIVFGHRPAGEAPMLVASPDGKFRLLAADVSYKKPVNGRLQAPAVRLQDDVVTMETILPSGEQVRARHKIGEGTLLGTVRDGVQLVGVNPRGEWIGSRMDGYEVTLKKVPHGGSCRRIFAR